jgi:hypothetical protein
MALLAMKRPPFVLLAFLLGGVPVFAAASSPEPVSGDVVLKDFRFAAGETLPEVRIHYRTTPTTTWSRRNTGS